MNTKATDTAFPAPMDALAGLTKREYFAALAMQGICANQHTPHWDAERIAEYSVKYADALIEALNKQP